MVPGPPAVGVVAACAPEAVLRRVGAIPSGGPRRAAPPSLDGLVEVAVLAYMVRVGRGVIPPARVEVATEPDIATRTEGCAPAGAATVLVAAAAFAGGRQAVAPGAPVRAVGAPSTTAASPIALEGCVAAHPPRMTAAAAFPGVAAAVGADPGVVRAASEARRAAREGPVRGRVAVTVPPGCGRVIGAAPNRAMWVLGDRGFGAFRRPICGRR